jgi:hypothetical protein
MLSGTLLPYTSTWSYKGLSALMNLLFTQIPSDVILLPLLPWLSSRNVAIWLLLPYCFTLYPPLASCLVSPHILFMIT